MKVIFTTVFVKNAFASLVYKDKQQMNSILVQKEVHFINFLTYK